MRIFLAVAVALCLMTALHAQKASSPKAPDKIVFEAKTGNVTFLHDKHTDRVKGDCKACHPKPFAQSKAPLNFKVHKAAETKKESCATCHVAGGTAFAATGNCTKCHVKAKA